MLYACTVRFDVPENLKNFLDSKRRRRPEPPGDMIVEILAEANAGGTGTTRPYGQPHLATCSASACIACRGAKQHLHALLGMHAMQLGQACMWFNHWVGRSVATALPRPCLVHPKSKKFSRFSVTSNLVAHARSIKYRRKQKLITQLSWKSRDESFDPS